MKLKKQFNIMRQYFRRFVPLQDIPRQIFIVGAQKAGTSSLHAYFSRHPSIITGLNKELAFFSREKMYQRGLEFYRLMYPAWFRGSHALDSTPEYLYYSKAAKRLYDYRPDSKIIVLLREPISRAFSAFNHYSQAISKPRFKNRISQANQDGYDFFMPLIASNQEATIEYFVEAELDAINSGKNIEEPGLIRRGIYAPQLARYFELFGRENVLVLFSDELSSDPEKVTNQALDFIGLPHLVGCEYRKMHVREYTVEPAAKEFIRQKAGNLFEQDKKNLKMQYGIEVSW